MVKREQKKGAKRPKTVPRAIRGKVYELLEKMGGSWSRSRLSALWDQWAEVVGAEIAELGKPASHSGKLLVLKCADSMAMQELQFLKDEVLKKINEFLEAGYFEEIRIQLEGFEKKQKKDAVIESSLTEPQKILKSPLSGAYLCRMNPESPAARCYARFAGIRIQGKSLKK